MIARYKCLEKHILTSDSMAPRSLLGRALQGYADNGRPRPADRK
jgi:hypothetical protein